jgi:hypothetical protein
MLTLTPGFADTAATEGIDSSGKYWKYRGELFQGLPHGRGNIGWEDGDSYEGEFRLVRSFLLSELNPRTHA